ncbi:hypothetical protein C8Q72DRAFT_751951, partial [Fomitopsis betulina]
LTRLVKEFPTNMRPKFHNYGHKVMKFPFELREKDQHATKPDVIASIPALRRVAPLYRWRHVAVVFELKTTRAHDPMKTDAPDHWDTLTQLAKSARSIMLSQGRLYCFVVGIYGGNARIFRFDHAGAISSPAFDYVKRPEILHKFLWRLFHPAVKGCTIVGQDPTVSLGTAKDRALVKKLARKCDPEWAPTPESRKAVRRFVMRDDGGNETTYLAYKLLYVNPRIFSRAGQIWEAFKLDAKESSTREERYIIKDAWRQLGRLDEAGFYEMLRDKETDEAVFGVANYVCGRDYGGETNTERRAAEEEERQAASNDNNAEKHRRIISHSGKAVPALSKKEEKRRVQDIRAGHRTVSAGHNRDTNLPPERALKQVYLHERSHVRMVLKTVGTPLADFNDTKELATAFLDAIEGHRQAYEKGVIHRDISEGNVMICRDPFSPFKGFIHDFDFSFSWLRFLAKRGMLGDLATWVKYCVEHGHEPTAPGESDPLNDSKERTGTPLFMAVEILRGKVTHEARHDLESFFWLFLYVVLHHTRHSRSLNPRAIRLIFGGPDDGFDDCLARKQSFLTFDEPVTVEGNVGLTYILKEFHALCSRSLPRSGVPAARPGMTHQDVIVIFKRGLAMDWPKANDGPLHRELPKN